MPLVLLAPNRVREETVVDEVDSEEEDSDSKTVVTEIGVVMVAL